MAMTYKKVRSFNSRINIDGSWISFFIFLTIFIGFRHEVGGDWDVYIQYAEDLKGLNLYSVFLLGDPAYELLNWIGANVGGGIYFVNLVCASIFSLGLIVFCRTQPRPWLAMVVAIPYLVVVVAMGYTRQGVAIGLAMLAITKLMSGSVLHFIVWVVVAALFHKSAVVLIPLAIFSSTKHRMLAIFGIIVSTLILFVLLVQDYVDHLVKNYIEAEYSSSGAVIRVAMNALPAAIFLCFKKRFNFDSKNHSFWIWIAWSALLFIPLLIFSPSSTAIDRFALYWIPLQLFVWSRLPDAFGVNGRQNINWVFVVTNYSALVMIIWFFFADHAFAWLPYRFYPWEMLWS
jgi:hypothetical protein